MRLAVVDVFVRAVHHGFVRGTGVEPHVENVGGLVVLSGFFGGHEVFGLSLHPGFDAFFFNALGDFFHDFERTRMQFTRCLVHEEGQGYAPVALTRDAPVGTVLDHGVQTVVAPGRDELGGIDTCQSRFAQALFFGFGVEHALGVGRGLVHADEPLSRCTIDERRLVAPAVHVAVLDHFAVKQHARHAHRVNNLGLSLPDVETAEEREPVGIDAVAHYRVENLIVGHAVGLARNKVVQAVGRSRVHDARTARGFHVLTEEHRREALEAFVQLAEGVHEADVIEVLAVGFADDLAFELVALEAIFHKVGAQNQVLVAAVNESVRQIRVHVNGLVGRDRPRSRGPDHRVAGLFNLHAHQFFNLGLVFFGKREGDVDGVAFAVGVFDFGFGQRRAAVKAPVNGLQAAVHVALLHDAGKRADFGGFRFRAHRQVRIFPVGEHAQTLEAGFLLGDLFLGIGAGLGHQVGLFEPLAVHLFDLDFDRHAVAVPARHVGDIVALKKLGLVDDVLENLV